MSKIFAGVDEVQAAFWNSPVTRAEIQKVFDEYTEATVKLQEKMMALDFALSYLLEKFDVQESDVKAFMERKAAEFMTKAKTEVDAKAVKLTDD